MESRRYEEERVQGGDEGDEQKEEDKLSIQQEGINMVKSFGSFHSAVIDAANSMDCHVPGDLGVRPIHWEEQVTVDRKLDSFLSGYKKEVSIQQ
jgi:hypothetical protein